MLLHSFYRFRIPGLLVAVLLAVFVVASAQTPFVTMVAKGEILVDDAGNPTKLSLDLTSTFRPGPNSNGINPLAEGLTGELEYAGSVTPCLMVAVAAGCFTQTSSGYRVQMQDFHNCGVSIRLLNAPQTPNEILPFVELLPYCDRFDLRLTPGSTGTWDLKLSAGFIASTPNGPVAAIIALLHSPTKVKLAIGDDAGEVTIGKIEFKGDD